MKKKKCRKKYNPLKNMQKIKKPKETDYCDPILDIQDYSISIYSHLQEVDFGKINLESLIVGNLDFEIYETEYNVYQPDIDPLFEHYPKLADELRRIADTIDNKLVILQGNVEKSKMRREEPENPISGIYSLKHLEKLNELKDMHILDDHEHQF